VEVIYGSRRSGGFERYLDEAGAEIDAVLLSRPQVAALHMGALHRKAPQARIVYYGHDLHFRRLEREAAATGRAQLEREARRCERQERAIWRGGRSGAVSLGRGSGRGACAGARGGGARVAAIRL
jgi:hypothetical protein